MEFKWWVLITAGVLTIIFICFMTINSRRLNKLKNIFYQLYDDYDLMNITLADKDAEIKNPNIISDMSNLEIIIYLKWMKITSPNSFIEEIFYSAMRKKLTRILSNELLNRDLSKKEQEKLYEYIRGLK